MANTKFNEVYNVKNMVVENVRCLLPEESSDTYEIMCHKSSQM
jgi:hypothetical protein